MASRWATPPVTEEGPVDVLYVGSDSDLADMYRLKLELDGYRVRSVTTLRNWTGPRPDLVFIDLEQPDRAGFAELTRLHSDLHLAGVPAILLVSDGPESLETHGLTLTPQEYLLRARPSAGYSQTMAAWSDPPATVSAPRFK